MSYTETLSACLRHSMEGSDSLRTFFGRKMNSPTFAAMRPIIRCMLVCFAILASLHALASASLSLLSYNIRYDNPGDGINAWPKRKQKVFQLIESHHPDIFCIQEGLHHQVKAIDSVFCKKYSYYGVGRDDGKEAGEYCAIFFLSKKFEQVDAGTFWLSPESTTPGSIGWDAAITRICSWVRLREKKSGRTLFVFNTHFDHIGEKAREKSAMLLLDQIQLLTSGQAHILCGDFNAEPQEAAIQTLRHPEETGLNLITPSSNKTCTFTGFETTSGICKCIDFQFVSSEFLCIHSTIDDQNDGHYYPSDHLALISTLQWKKKKK